MTAVNLKTLLTKANKKNYAIAGLVVITWEDAIAYTEAADETGIPIILQAGPSCREFTPISILGKMFRYLADQTKIPICCHLDHGFSYRECKEGIDNGFTSIMFLPFNLIVCLVPTLTAGTPIVSPSLIALLEFPIMHLH